MTLRYPSADYSAAIGFGGNALDRMSERRDDEAFVTSLRADPAARCILFSGDLLVARGADVAAVFTRLEAEALGADLATAVFLGLDGEGPLFASSVAAPADDGRHALHNLRALAVADVVPERVLGAVAQARSVLGWHATHGFCARCGAPTVMAAAGMRRDCPSCGAHHFPRTDPVVIMLAVAGGALPPRPAARLSAGPLFLPRRLHGAGRDHRGRGSPGDLGRRRGVRTRGGGRVAYHASQPWPFPSSLMIGCFAEAVSEEIDPRDLELEDVRWFAREDIARMIDETHPTFNAPPSIAIAWHLLGAYARHGAPVIETAPAAAPAPGIAAAG